ncbi:MAG: 60S ribosomal export protein NMD3 [Acidilobaceae archaeon]
MGRMCPRCGRENTQFVGPLCSDCYIQLRGVAEAPASIDFVYCQSCGSYRAQGVWVEGRESLEETLAEYVQLFLPGKLKRSPEIDELWISGIRILGPAPTRGLLEIEIEVSGRSGDVALVERKKMKVKIDGRLCPLCLKRKTRTGYAGIVQVRSLTGGYTKTLDSRIRRVLGELESRIASAIIAIDEHKHGIDILVVDHATARLIASKMRSTLGGVVRESYKISGVDSRGRRQSILSISVKVPDLEPGESIMLEGRVYRVVALGSERAVVEDLEAGEIREVSFEKLAEARRLHST